MEDLLPAILIGLFVILLVVERVRPARPLPPVRGWLARGVVFFALMMAVNAFLPALLAPLLASYSLFEGERLGTLGGALLVIVVLELVSYAAHRAFHRVHFLWRWVHQMHHAAERVDVAGSVIFHPTS